MKTEYLIIGKGDDIITMILDNLESRNQTGEITIYNNLDLPVNSPFDHPDFNINLLSDLDVNEYSNWILGVYKPEFKKKLVGNFNKKKFINVIHKDFDISRTSSIGYGCLVNSMTSVAAHTQIGNFVSINRNVSIGHHVVISNYVSINPGCNIAGHVTIGEGSTIGIGTQIVDGVKIGKNTIIGAGSIVTRDISDGVIAWGSPCKVVKENL